MWKRRNLSRSDMETLHSAIVNQLNQLIRRVENFKLGEQYHFSLNDWGGIGSCQFLITGIPNYTGIADISEEKKEVALKVQVIVKKNGFLLSEPLYNDTFIIVPRINSEKKFRYGNFEIVQFDLRMW